MSTGGEEGVKLLIINRCTQLTCTWNRLELTGKILHKERRERIIATSQHSDLDRGI